MVQGVPVCFDAKETVTSTFPLHNIHAHQVEFMREFERQGGVAFIILFYSRLDEAYYLRFRDVERFWERGKSGGRKSFTYEELDKSWRIPVRRRGPDPLSGDPAPRSGNERLTAAFVSGIISFTCYHISILK